MIIQPNSKLVMIGDSVTDCERARPVGEGLFEAHLFRPPTGGASFKTTQTIDYDLCVVASRLFLAAKQSPSQLGDCFAHKAPSQRNKSIFFVHP
jgi:hypothetical protein